MRHLEVVAVKEGEVAETVAKGEAEVTSCVTPTSD